AASIVKPRSRKKVPPRKTTFATTINDDHDDDTNQQQPYSKTILDTKLAGIEPWPITEEFCSCKKSKCLKMYCNCFASSSHCAPECNCHECHNQVSSRDAEWLEAYNRGNINPIFKEQEISCRCMQSRCVKKYCE